MVFEVPKNMAVAVINGIRQAGVQPAEIALDLGVFASAIAKADGKTEERA